MENKIIEKGVSVLRATEKYQSQLDILNKNYNKVRAESRDLKSLVELNPEVNEVMKYLQMKQHENSVGNYEQLLSSLLTEVLPGYREIVLDLEMVRQSPALDVMIKKDPNNPPEDVLRGTGGSVTNIVVAGFRIISVIRSGARRFLLLDEADCWLKEDYFPAFSKMLKEVSENLGVQILLISHDKNSYFTGAIDHQVEIYRDNNGKIQSRFNELPDWDVEEDIIKSIRLENFQSHEDTFIPLSPTITILRGDNDLGKSSIASAFRSVFYGEGAATDVKHFTDKSIVTVEFNKEGKYLVWERRKKGRPVETFTMYSQSHGYGNPLHKTEGLSRGAVPDWLMSETGLGLFEGLDVQLTWQKEPLAFLSAGPHVRAKALAIGTEEDHIQKMMVLSKEKNSQNKSMLKSKEAILEDQRQNIIPLKKIRNIETAEIEVHIKSINESKEKLAILEPLLNDWKKKEYENNLLRKINNVDCNIYLKDNSQKEKERKDLILTWDKEKSKNNILEKNKVIDNNVILTQPISENLKNMAKEMESFISKNMIFLKIKEVEKVNISEKLSIDIRLSSDLCREYKIASDIKNKLLKINKIEKNIIINDNTEKRINIISMGKSWDRENKKKIAMNKLSLIKNIELPCSNKEIIKNMIEIGIDMKKLEKNKNIYLNEINAFSNESSELKEKIKNEYPVCPTCKREWVDDHIHK